MTDVAKNCLRKRGDVGTGIDHCWCVGRPYRRQGEKPITLLFYLTSKEARPVRIRRKTVTLIREFLAAIEMSAPLGFSPSMLRFLLGLLAFLLAGKAVGAQTTLLRNRSDWWSINNEGFRREGVRPSNGNLAAGIFQIAGVDLGREQFNQSAMKMGKAPVVERGDGSTGRQQVCYTAGEAPRKVYLIFEFGEDESVFYLFSDGADWSGQSLCVTTKQLSILSGTPSGLKLGITRAEVQAILGKADVAADTRLVYSREVKEKATPAEFETLRKDYPEHLSDKAAHEKFDFYTIEIYIEARFGNSGLNYLAVSKSGGVE